MIIFTVMIGLALLLIGRQLFWIAIAGLGFIFGMNYASQFIQTSPEATILISLGIGAVGAVIGYTLQRAAAVLLGFLAGWFLTVSLINYLHFDIDFIIILAALGGVIGIGLVSLIFDWSLIILSTLSGAALITQSIQYAPQIKLGVFAALVILGLTIQGFALIQEGSEGR
jgi:hypothetical protein